MTKIFKGILNHTHKHAKHTSYREGNALANYVANMAFDASDRFEIHGLSDLPSQVKMILSLN